jgi:hypothetical protein
MSGFSDNFIMQYTIHMHTVSFILYVYKYIRILKEKKVAAELRNTIREGALLCGGYKKYEKE